ncbi:NACHT, LRR and PYD domains-containing protein 12 isoform X33 [Labeo rohita]|uniref:NACHT, LRR and PYD domains-containing protein 12 isoform X32 n=1 Tax=Labeo rohita TaxID=84645 RepID=UPI0021E22753|nr:NACHT, LRR and PYD domains-containing protein 12 isoform X32 [Labeo rohita]XP_050960082.1 NACHT, LRR and PYD domains-containing protein 12 isoform X33 [Labeo rohita]
MRVYEEKEQDAPVDTQRAASPGFSSVSMKSNNSMIIPPGLSDVHIQRAASSGSSCVSMKSNNSMIIPPGLSDVDTQKAAFPGSSYVSMNSNNSMIIPPGLSDVHTQRAAFPGSSYVSMNSNNSMIIPPGLSDVHTQRAAFPGFSYVSMNSNNSMIIPPGLSDGRAVISGPISGRSDQIRYVSHQTFTYSYRQNHSSHHDTEADLQLNSHQPVHYDLQRVKDQHKTSMKNKYESLFEGIKLQENQTLLNRIYTQLYIIEGESEGVNEEHEVLQMEKSYKTLKDTPINCNDIFNPLPEPGYEEMRREKKDKIKTVLTKGIAGIGKTVSVQKFILDWAEGKVNQDVDFMFVLTFRELNLIKDHQYSLHRLLLAFHPELQYLDSWIYDKCKVVFIFDGLDESRISLMFSDSQTVSDVTEISSVSVLMSNLMRGDLLPSALIWITTRPAAANQIPSKYINRVTEIQGFNDPQKEEYFRKRISNKQQASRIISHIRRARSLHIMCHIPVFCWISATVLQDLLKQDQKSAEIPQTLTEMYIYFLLIQTNVKNQKYEERNSEELLQSNREVIVKLAELAFNQLMKGNVMFYEEDLRESGIDVTDASVYSGICTEIFREESVIYHRKVYSFVHLSFQEFFAALYVFYCYLHKNSKIMKMFLTGNNRNQCETVPLNTFLKGAMTKALKSKNGHLDLFLRFLHGISLESNQKLLQDVLIHTENNTEIIKKIIKNLKQGKINDVSPDRWMNLSHCLIEMKDNSVVKEMQAFLNSKTSQKNLSPAQCSTLANMILMSEEVLDELDLKQYNIKLIEGRWRLLPAVRNCRKALLAGCNLTGQHCEIVASALQSSISPLRELDLSNNNLQDSGGKLLAAGLKSPNCQLNILRLSGCLVKEEGCAALASALSSNLSHLRELDLSNNHLQDSGGKLLAAGLKSPNCQLNILRLSDCLVKEEGCAALASALSSNLSHLRELDLSNNHLQDSGGKLLAAGLKNQNCQLNILRLSGCLVKEEGCAALASALSSNLSHLRELDLSNNRLQDSGGKLLADGLKSPNCQLNILRLSGCLVKEEVCAALASALSSNLSHLRELDLSNNPLQDSGGKLLAAGLKSPNCQLNILRLSGCVVKEEGCADLASALSSNLSHLRELDLSNNHLQDSGGKLLAAGLKSPNCQLNILRLSGCLVKEEGCADLASALSSNLSHLRELDLSNNRLQDSGGKLLAAGLKSPNCQLNILRLSGCLVKEEGCVALASALSSNLSHLRELDLSNNHLQDSGGKLLAAGLKSPNCQLNILRLSDCMIKEEGVDALASALSSNPSHLRELDLSYSHPGESGVKLFNHLKKLKLAYCNFTNQHCEILASALQSPNSPLRELDLSNNNLRDSGVKLLCTGLKSPNCPLNTLRLSDCKIKEGGVDALASALSSNSSHLRELDLSYNHPGESGVKLLNHLKNLKLAYCNLTDHQHCELLASALQSPNSPLRELDLSNNFRRTINSRVKLETGLEIPNCPLNILRLIHSNLTDQHCELLASALQSPNSHLRELDLSNNNLDSGVKLLCAGLEGPNCTLNILRLIHCHLTDQHCGLLASALQSPNSPLRELDLSANDLKDSGVELLCAGLESPNCQLNTLRLSGCMVTEEGCAALASALSSNPSHLRELDLSYNLKEPSGVKRFNHLKNLKIQWKS